MESAASPPVAWTRLPRHHARVVARRLQLMNGALRWLWRVGLAGGERRLGVVREIDTLGVGALHLVGGAAFLVGLLATFQLAYQLRLFSAEPLGARTLGWFVAREIGPLVAALLVVTRSAAAIAGELAAMTANAEVDALHAMGLDPVRYLVAPRLGGLLVAIPALTLVADGMIILGAWLANVAFLRFNTLYFLEQIHAALTLHDVLVGLGKSVLFAAIVAITAADEGLCLDRRHGVIATAAARAVVACVFGVLAADTVINAVVYLIPRILH